MVAVCEEAEGSWMDGVCDGGGKRKIGEKGRECSDVQRLSGFPFVLVVQCAAAARLFRW